MKKQHHTYHYSPTGEIWGVCTASVPGNVPDTFVVEDKIPEGLNKTHGFDKITKEIYEAETDVDGKAVIANGKVKRKIGGKKNKIKKNKLIKVI